MHDFHKLSILTNALLKNKLSLPNSEILGRITFYKVQITIIKQMQQFNNQNENNEYGQFDLILGANSISQPLTGIGHYSCQLGKSLALLKTIRSLRFFANNQLWAPNNLPLATSENASTIKQWCKMRVQNYASSYSLREARRNRAFKKLTKARKKKIKADLIYHELQTITQAYEGRCVTTVHDLSCIRYPQYHPKGRVVWFEKNLMKSLTQASHIITVSSVVRDELIRDFAIQPNKISTIYHGVTNQFKPRSAKQLAGLLKRYGLRYQSFILSVATLEPRKNLSRLLDAYLKINIKQRKKFPLVLIGAFGWKNSKLQERILSLQERGIVYYLGYLAEQDLALLYAAAKLFVYPSLYEGFGLPVLEAMASGIPVITSKNTAMAEVAEMEASLINPFDADEISERIAMLLENNEHREILIEQGLQRANLFTWEKCAKATAAIYEKIVKGNSR